jgi:hypothetical protein
VEEPLASTQPLVDDLSAARAELFAALDAVDPASLTTPGLLGAWSGREMIAHLGYWAGHAVEVIHAVEEGRIEEVGAGEPTADEVNETVARVARQTDLAAVRKREAASVEALVERLRRMDAGLLGLRLPDGATLEDGIREDGPDHYREHAAALRRTIGGGARD